MITLDSTDAIVIAGAIAAIGWVIWYFFLAERRVAAATEMPPSAD